MASPIDRVVFNYELLQHILLQADAFVIVLSTSVCRYWREVVMDSRDLARRMDMLQPPKHITYVVPSTIRKDGDRERVDAAKDLDRPWLFRTPASNGTLWVLRIPNAALEVFLLVRSDARGFFLVRLGTDSSTKRFVPDRDAWGQCRQYCSWWGWCKVRLSCSPALTT